MIGIGPMARETTVRKDRANVAAEVDTFRCGQLALKSQQKSQKTDGSQYKSSKLSDDRIRLFCRRHELMLWRAI